MSSSEPKSFVRLLGKYAKELEDEEELKPLFEPTAFPSLSQLSKVNIDNIDNLDNYFKAKEFLDIWKIISIVNSYQDFTLENANQALNLLESNLFIVTNYSTIAFDLEKKWITNSIIRDMDIAIFARIAEALSKFSRKEAEDWLLFTEKIRRKWKEYDMKSTLKAGIIKFINWFGQDSVLDCKLLILALKFLRKDERFKTHLEKEAVKYLENNIEDRPICKEILKMLHPQDFDEETAIKIKNWSQQVGNYTFIAKIDTIKIIKNIRKLFKEKSHNISTKSAKNNHPAYLNILDKEDITYIKDKCQNTNSNSKIYLGTMKSNGQNVVVKEYQIKDKFTKKSVYQEVAYTIFLSKKDEMFMEYYGLYLEFDPYHSEFSFGIVMEPCDMDLEELIQEEPINNETTIKGLIDSLLDGFKLLHDYGIAHRDIKPKNIFVKKTTEGIIKLKIADYSISSLISKGTALFSEQGLAEFGGQTAYFAPEIYSQQNADSREYPSRIIINKYKADVFALGLVFLELYIQKVPYGSYNEREEWMGRTGLNYINNEIKSNWIKNLLNCMLTKSPSKRKRLSELVKMRKNYLDQI